MTEEHKHIWEPKHAYDGQMVIEWIECKCEERMKFNEIARRVNATECLSATDAREVSKYIPGFKGIVAIRTDEALRAYADTLEGEDD